MSDIKETELLNIISGLYGTFCIIKTNDDLSTCISTYKEGRGRTIVRNISFKRIYNLQQKYPHLASIRILDPKTCNLDISRNDKSLPKHGEGIFIYGIRGTKSKEFQLCFEKIKSSEKLDLQNLLPLPNFKIQRYKIFTSILKNGFFITQVAMSEVVTTRIQVNSLSTGIVSEIQGTKQIQEIQKHLLTFWNHCFSIDIQNNSTVLVLGEQFRQLQYDNPCIVTLKRNLRTNIGTAEISYGLLK